MIFKLVGWPPQEVTQFTVYLPCICDIHVLINVCFPFVDCLLLEDVSAKNSEGLEGKLFFLSYNSNRLLKQNA